MRIYLDSSAYAKRFVEESGSDVVDKILSDASELGFSIISIAELMSALNRRLREKNLTASEYKEIKKQLSIEIDDVQIIQLTENVIKNSILLLETNILRAMDSLHIACAIEWKADLFITADKRQIKVAKSVIKNVKLV